MENVRNGRRHGHHSTDTERVDGVYPVPMEVIGSQLESIVNDIEVHAVKIGLLPNAKTLELVVELLRTFQLTANIVVDPIFKASNGFPLADEKTIQAYKEKLFPMAEAVSPIWTKRRRSPASPSRTSER